MNWTLHFNAEMQTFLAQQPPHRAPELQAQEGTETGLQGPDSIKGGHRPSLISLTSITWSVQGGERPEIGKERDDTWKERERDQVTEEKQIQCLSWELKMLFLPSRAIYKPKYFNNKNNHILVLRQ